MGGSCRGVTPKWIMENPIEVDDLEVPPILGNIHIQTPMPDTIALSFSCPIPTMGNKQGPVHRPDHTRRRTFMILGTSDVPQSSSPENLGANTSAPQI